MGELQKISDRRVFCVFVWRGDNKYIREEAIHEYKTRDGAEKKAEKLNEVKLVYVVREIYV